MVVVCLALNSERVRRLCWLGVVVRLLEGRTVDPDLRRHELPSEQAFARLHFAHGGYYRAGADRHLMRFVLLMPLFNCRAEPPAPTVVTIRFALVCIRVR